MNGINGNWDDRLNQLKYQDLQREIEYLHLLNEVEGARYGLLARLGKALQDRLYALGSRVWSRKAQTPGMFKPTHKKASI
jgi:hypothetical protein